MMDQSRSYSEVVGVEPFDWRKALSSKKDIDYQALAWKSGEWVTCACGNQCSIIPRDKHGEPLDAELLDLGYRFHTCIQKEDREEARATLEFIEQRSAFLINQILEE